MCDLKKCQVFNIHVKRNNSVWTIVTHTIRANIKRSEKSFCFFCFFFFLFVCFFFCVFFCCCFLLLFFLFFVFLLFFFFFFFFFFFLHFRHIKDGPNNYVFITMEAEGEDWDPVG